MDPESVGFGPIAQPQVGRGATRIGSAARGAAGVDPAHARTSITTSDMWADFMSPDSARRSARFQVKSRVFNPVRTSGPGSGLCRGPSQDRPALVW